MKTDAYGVRAVERAADVLGALAQADQPQTLSAVAGRAGLSVPTGVVSQPGGKREKSSRKTFLSGRADGLHGRA